MIHRISKTSVATIALAACSTPGVQSGAVKSLPESAATPMLGEWGVEHQQRDLAVAPGDDFDTYANGTRNATDEMPADVSRFGMSIRVSLEAKVRHRLVVDPHSPPKYRINGVVRNLDAWYTAFEVTPEHALYLPPGERVRIW